MSPTLELIRIVLTCMAFGIALGIVAEDGCGRVKDVRLIIDNRTDLADWDVLGYVTTVMRKGRISNGGKQYCYASKFADGVVVYTDLNKTSDRFVVVMSE